MLILIIVLIRRTIIFKLKYKISGFRVGPSSNGVRSKISEVQMGLVRKTQIFGLIKLSPGNFVGLEGLWPN